MQQLTVQRRAVRQFVPPQHGAWAMLIVPYAAGVLVAGWSWVAAPLLGAWLAGYLLSYYAFQVVKTGRVRRYRQQLTAYAALMLPLAAVVVWARPAVLWFAPPFSLLWAVNAWHARRRRERALVNDLASVAQSCLMVPVVATVVGELETAVAGAFVVCLVYFIGTVLYVKTMIRERDSVAYRRWSVAYHAVALPVGAWLGPAVTGVFGWLLVRAWVLPGRRLAPRHVGLVELANCLLLLAAIAATWGMPRVG